MPLVLHPERYHGDRETHDFFEGWYFKCVNRTSGLVIAVVPGIFRSRAQTPEHSHAFVFVNVNGTEQHYYRFPLDAFVAAKDEFKVTIAGDNVFTANGITLNLEPKDGDDATLSLVGRLTFAGGIPWPVSIVSPGVMGPVAYMPRVECFHGIVSMDHEVNGSLKIGATHEVGEKFVLCLP
jgi:tocopherol cyclase